MHVNRVSSSNDNSRMIEAHEECRYLMMLLTNLACHPCLGLQSSTASGSCSLGFIKFVLLQGSCKVLCILLLVLLQLQLCLLFV